MLYSSNRPATDDRGGPHAVCAERELLPFAPHDLLPDGTGEVVTR